MTDTDIVIIDDEPDSDEVSTFTFVKRLFTVLTSISVCLVVLMILFSAMYPTIDWRDPINLQLEDGVFHEVENGTFGEPFNGTHHDLVPGDVLDFAVVSFSHYTTRSSTTCYYDSDGNDDCWTTYWDVFTLDVGGMNFSVEGYNGFKHSCFNAFCDVTATVDGDDWGLDMYGQRLTITVQEFEWVRWCQGEEVCE